MVVKDTGSYSNAADNIPNIIIPSTDSIGITTKIHISNHLIVLNNLSFSFIPQL
ncbi:MAG: hypothetical protein [Chaetfec virus UA24_2340]|nr:MAG: hypothetical protein [Chaetfec virus UA24_2340]